MTTQEQIDTSEPTDFLLESICLRPRMHYAPLATTRDLILFLRGVCCGVAPPHGSCLAEFEIYVNQCFQRKPYVDWCTILLEEFSDKRLFEAGAAIARLLREWRATKSTLCN